MAYPIDNIENTDSYDTINNNTKMSDDISLIMFNIIFNCSRMLNIKNIILELPEYSYYYSNIAIRLYDSISNGVDVSFDTFNENNELYKKNFTSSYIDALSKYISNNDISGYTIDIYHSINHNNTL